jgi:hypothetical protein
MRNHNLERQAEPALHRVPRQSLGTKMRILIIYRLGTKSRFNDFADYAAQMPQECEFTRQPQRATPRRISRRFSVSSAVNSI